MPRLSDTMESGTIARWLKQEGDEVKKGEIIAEIETDKANMEMEAYDSGVLAQILVREGQTANLGDPIAYIAASAEEAQGLKAAGATEARRPEPQGVSSGEAPPGPQPSAEDATPTGGKTAPPQVSATGADGHTEPQERIKASPLARRMAQEHDIDLQQVRGTGPGGRITKEDIQAFLREGPKAAPAAAPAAPQPASAPAVAPAPPVPGGCPVYTSDAADDRLCVDLGGRRIIKKQFTFFTPQCFSHVFYDPTCSYPHLLL